MYGRFFENRSRPVRVAAGCGLLVLLLAAATGVGFLFHFWQIALTNTAMVFILAVMLTARFTRGYGYCVAASVLSTLAYDFFFIDPRYTFSLRNVSYLVTLLFMTAVAFTMGTITSSASKSAREARTREEETQALYRLTNLLSGAANMEQIAACALREISRVIGCGAGFICMAEDGTPERTFLQQKQDGSLVRRQVRDYALLAAQCAQCSESCSGDEFCDFFLPGQEGVAGVVRIPLAAGSLNASQRGLLISMGQSTALAMDRFFAARSRIRSREQAQQEHYRGNLLRAISHDLRTPLAGLMGTAEMLMDMTDKTDTRYGLMQGIYADADWLHGLVENILSLTRLQDGRVALKKELQPVEEVVGGAISHIEKRAPQREIAVHVPQEYLLVPMDSSLIQQVLVNLLDNAVKHTAPGDAMGIEVSVQGENAVFEVWNTGEPISDEEMPHIFQMFYTTKANRADAQKGVGLGLSICQAIVNAHSGKIRAENTDEGLVKFTFTLPLKE